MARYQPAYKNYFLHDGFIELINGIKGTFKNCNDIIARNRPRGRYYTPHFWAFDDFNDKPLENLRNCFNFGFSGTNIFFTSIFAFLICIIVTCFQLAILMTIYFIAFIFIAIIMLLDWLFCLIHSIATHCPNCQEKFILPAYVCNCGKIHDRLRPGVYGIFNRKCLCDQILPTTFLNGRQKLNAHCPVCDYNLTDGLQSSICIPVVGGAHTGKTCYITMTMLSLMKNASAHGMTFEYIKNDRDAYEENVDRLNSGKCPEKTTILELIFYQFALTPKDVIKQVISLCDVAGELYNVKDGSVNIVKQKGLRYANAFILIIDPLSIPAYKEEVEKTSNIIGNRKTQPIDEVIDTLINTLQNIFSLKAKDIIKTDVAVVFTKSDIPGLNEMIGESAVLKNAPNLSQKVKYQTQNKLCEEFLINYGEENFLHNIKARFNSIQFFTCSALGHPENGLSFVSQNVEEPFWWLLKKIKNIFS